jgi:hypothetical protein
MVCVEERSARSLVTGKEALIIEGATARTDRFDALVLESIDESLTDLLGRRAREAVYDHLERNCFLARGEIPKRLDDFFELLSDTFGKGSKTIAKVIAKRLHSKLGWEFVEIPSYEFVDYIHMARTRLERELTNHPNGA